jgi:hypothetical protein
MMNQKAAALSFIVPRSIVSRLFGFLVACVPTAETAELAELQPFCGRLFILRRNIVTTLTFRALQHNIIARHNSPSPNNPA